MGFYWKGIVYSTVIDPMLRSLQRAVVDRVGASERAGKKGTTNVSFRVLDASDLSCFRDNEFDVAVTSMATHQFDPGPFALCALHIFTDHPWKETVTVSP